VKQARSYSNINKIKPETLTACNLLRLLLGVSKTEPSKTQTSGSLNYPVPMLFVLSTVAESSNLR